LPDPPESKSGWPWTRQTNPQIYDSRINWPKVSIVTPSYNQDQFIEETIRSVLLQNYPNLEYIIIDGGSTDQTRQILEKYSQWISYWQSEKDNGQGQAINLGFSMASGDYYAWVNSDDYYLENVLNTVVTTFLRSGSSFIYGYGFNYHVKEARLELIRVLPFLDYFIRIPSLIQPSCFWSADNHQPIWEELQCSLDYELWQRLLKGKSRKLVKQALSVANVHDNGKTSDPKMKAAWEKDHQLICSENAHGAVNDWNRMMFFHRIYTLLTKIFEKINLSQKARIAG